MPAVRETASFGISANLRRRVYSQVGSRFLRENPTADIQFTFHSGVTQELLDGLTDRKFDLVFCSEPPPKLNVTAVPIQKQDLVLITPKNHPLSSRHTIDLSERALSASVFGKSSGMRFVVEQMFSKIAVEPQIAYETEEDQVIAGLVSQGFGIAVVPYMDLLLQLDVKILQINAPASERKLFMVQDNNVFMPPCVKQFQQFVLNQNTLPQT